MVPLPASARVHARPAVAEALIARATTLPAYDDNALRSLSLQEELRRSLSAAGGVAFDALVDAVRARLAAPPHAAYVSGLMFDASHLLFVTLSSVFGEVVDPYRQPWSKLVRHIRPSTDRVIDGLGILNEALHTDGTDWREPNDFTCLLCVRPDRDGGGRTRLLDSTAVTNLVGEHLGDDAAATLAREPVPWRIADELGGGILWSSILSASRMRWLRFTIDASLPEHLAPLVDGMHDLLSEPSLAIDFAMEANGLLIVNNKRCLHARTGIADPVSSERLVLRTKVRSQRRDWRTAAA